MPRGVYCIVRSPLANPCGLPCMYTTYNLVKKLVDHYRIFIQIDEYLEWKSRFANLLTRKDVLYTFVSLTKRNDIRAVTIGDLERYRLYLVGQYGSSFFVISHLREVRCLLRFHHKRGLDCLRPEVIREIDINLHMR